MRALELHRDRGLVLLLVLAWLALGPGCADMSLDSDDDSAGDDDMAGDDDAGDDDSGDDDVGDDDTEYDNGPCGDGMWGDIPLKPGPVMLVADWGSEAGDGSMDLPYATLEQALQAVRDMGDPATIALGPGNWPAAVELTEVSGDFSDRGLTIAGCSPGETKIVGADDDKPAIAIRNVDDVTLSGLTFDGGRPAIAVLDRAGDEAPIVLRDVVVQNAVEVGIVIDDQEHGDARATLDGVEVSGTQTTRGDFGWGISVQRAQATILGGEISNVTGVGLFGHLAELDVDGTAIHDIQPDALGELGRGVHLQLMTGGILRNMAISNCADAGVYVHLGMDLTLEQLQVDGSAGAAIPNSAFTSGDGIVVTMGDETFSPDFFKTHLLSNDASNHARAPILVDGAWVEAIGNGGSNNVFDPGGWGIVVQNSPVIEGSDSVHDLDTDKLNSPVDLNTHELNWLLVSGS